MVVIVKVEGKVEWKLCMCLIYCLLCHVHFCKSQSGVSSQEPKVEKQFPICKNHLFAKLALNGLMSLLERKLFKVKNLDFYFGSLLHVFTNTDALDV